MSAKAGSAGSIALGVGLIVIGIIGLAGGGSGVPAIISGVLLITSGAVGLAMAPKTTNRETAKSQDLVIATSAEGIPAPVIFGEQRVSGNFGNYSTEEFRAVKVSGRSDGSKGADAAPANIIGYDYHLSFEYALCMGPVDEVVQVYSAPGEIVMMGADPTAVVFGADDYKEITLDTLDPTANAGSENGVCRIYKGSSTQQRVLSGDPYNYEATKTSGQILAGYTYKIGGHSIVNFTTYGAANNNVGTTFVATSTSGTVLTVSDWVYEYTGLNYRNVCWAMFLDFKIGRFPQPKSYHFILRRWPRHDSSYLMKRPDGTSITGFTVRGSANSSKRGYYEANPAAILYEVLTDTIWGRGLPQDIFDEDSWVACAAYFASKHIGMSLTIDTPDKVTQVIDSIRYHLKTITVWDGELLKLKCLLDTTQTHAAVQVLTKADIRSLTPSRPLWHSTINQVRAEFNNADRNYRGSAVHVSELGNEQLTQRINVEKINFGGFTDYNTTRRQAVRVLQERAYPALMLNWEMNRFHSQIEVGDVVKVIWNEYDQEISIYCLIVRIEDSDSTSDDIKVGAIEDRTLVPVQGTEATPAVPSVMGWEKIPELALTDVQLWTASGDAVVGTWPAAVVEVPSILNAFFDQSLGSFVILAQRPAAFFSEIKVEWATGSTYRQDFQSSTFAIAATMETDLEHFDGWDRSDAGFEFSLRTTADEAELLSVFSECDTPEQDLETIINHDGGFMIAGEEFLQIGIIENIGTNLYRARNIVRGRFGSRIKKHETGDQIYFVNGIGNKLGRGFSNQRGSVVKFRAYTFGPQPDRQKIDFNGGADFYFYHEGAQTNFTSIDQKYTALGNSPLPPEFYDYRETTANWIIRFRPRFRTIGTETGPFYGSVLEQLTPNATFNFTITLQNLTSGRQQPAQNTTMSFAPGSDSNPLSGLMTLTIPKQAMVPSGAPERVLITSVTSLPSVDHLVVNLV